MISETITYLSVLWLELIAVSILTIATLILVTVFEYWRLIELKLAAAVLVATILILMFSLYICDTEVWRAFLYSFSAMFLAAGAWTLVFFLVHFGIKRYRNFR